MIDIKKSIYYNLRRRIGLMIYQADANPVLFKILLRLIIMDDMLDWADWLGEDEKVMNKIKQCRDNLLLSVPEFKIIDVCPIPDVYVNVNTPQTNKTWMRLDSTMPGVSEIKYCCPPRNTENSDSESESE